MEGNGDGTFKNPVAVTLPPNVPANVSYRCILGDLNNDGKIDFVFHVRLGGTDPTVDVTQYIYLGNGDGTFALHPVTLLAGLGSNGVAFADLNADGKLGKSFIILIYQNPLCQFYLNPSTLPDLVFDHYKGTVPDRLYLGNGDGTFQDFTTLTQTDDGSGIAIDYDALSVPAAVTEVAIPWDIVFLDMVVNFTVASVEELTINYAFGKDRDFETILYEKDCETEVSNGNDAIYTLTDTPKDHNATHQMLKLDYSFNKTAIATSSIWNATTSKIEVCQRVKLYVPAAGSMGMLVVAEDIHKIDISFDFSVNFNLTNDLGAGEVGNETAATDVTSYVDAFKCSDMVNFVKDDSALIPNDELYICIISTSPDINVDTLQTMVRLPSQHSSHL